ncbi:hypothetical protein EVJ58_g10846 [Rhodofomes roseus]|uniref:BTB domain-containing protein n=1 Tax=Rhodofomes roseus TaxID=34475 RepID=A0A4Y9XLE4_9APHY|nr:hypothetical protein EVJ58_g10846 [Rhodofomes roseus]
MFPTIRDAPAPFNNPRADVVLRTCDGVDYRVRSSILAEASPVFGDIFDLAREAPSEALKTSEVADILLRFCYPVAAPTFTTFSQVQDVLTAVDKYLMEGLIEVVKKHLTDFSLDGAHPLRLYATAYAHRFEDVARIAAKETIGKPLQTVYVTELESLSAGAYYWLLEFHKTGKADVIPEVPFLSVDPSRTSARPPPGPHSRTAWISKYASPYPFGLPFADFTLRTCDGIALRVHSDLLRVASPYFRLMLADTSQSIEGIEKDSDGRIIGLVVPEHSNTIATVLQYVYPVERPDSLPDPQTASLLLYAAKKYDVVPALAPLQAMFLAFAAEHSLVIYAIACARYWVHEARHAALASMRMPLDDLCYVDELEAIPASCLYRLTQHRNTLGNMARRMVLSQAQEFLKQLTQPSSQVVCKYYAWVYCMDCRADTAVTLCRAGTKSSGLRKWWCDWLRRIAELLREVPSGQTVLDEQAIVCAVKDARDCPICRVDADTELRCYAKELSIKVDAMLVHEMSRITFF